MNMAMNVAMSLTLRHQLRVSGMIARHAFEALLREKLLYNIFFISLGFMFFAYLAALLVYGHQERVVLHFGMLVNALSIFGVAASAGSRLVRNESEQRTHYLILARPVSRVSYYIGTWTGIALFLLLNLTLLTLVLWGALKITEGEMTAGLLQATGLIWAEGLLVVAIAQFSSLMLRSGLATMVTFSFLFLAHNHEQIQFVTEKGGGTTGFFRLLMNLTPDAQAFLMDTRVYYQDPLLFSDWMLRMGYGLGWALIFVFLGNAIFFRKNL